MRLAQLIDLRNHRGLRERWRRQAHRQHESQTSHGVHSNSHCNTCYNSCVTISAMPEVAASEPRWLLLVHQLPARPSNLRVHVWRRLQQVGAVALRNSIYVLPNTPDAREDFEWIRAEITGRGGQVSILAGQAIDGYTDDELAASFRKARNDDYASLITGLEKLAKRLAGRTQRLSRTAIQREIAKARERFHALKTTDFFGAHPRERRPGGTRKAGGHAATTTEPGFDDTPGCAALPTPPVAHPAASRH